MNIIEKLESLKMSGNSSFEAGYNHAIKTCIKAVRNELAQPKEQPVEPASEWQAPEGWKLVPIEPTDGMVNVLHDPITRKDAIWIWRKMLAAAPTPPKEVKE